MIYKPVKWQWKIKIHSAQTLSIALVVWLALAQYYYLFLFLGIARMVLYFLRKGILSENPFSISIIRNSALILGAGIVFHSSYFWIGIGFIIFGEIIDRIEFYNELDIRDLFKK